MWKRVSPYQREKLAREAIPRKLAYLRENVKLSDARLKDLMEQRNWLDARINREIHENKKWHNKLNWLTRKIYGNS